MHQLKRNSNADIIKCLENYKAGRDQWVVDNENPEKSIPSGYCRKNIREELITMQVQRCAYCECNIGDKNSGQHHIEHFYERSHSPEKTFDWSNLFASCERSYSCGKNKAKHKTVNDNLIKPDEDDPEEYFLFVLDGTIKIRENLTIHKKQRAENTIKAFGLDCPSLCETRKVLLLGYQQTIKDIIEWAEIDLEEAQTLRETEIENTKNLPFATAIKHLLS